MPDYILQIDCDPTQEDDVQSLLFLTNSTGNSSNDLVIEAYFDSPEDRAAAREVLHEYELHDVDRERVDWLDRYEQSLEPLLIGERFIVAPDAKLIPRDTTRLAIIVPQEQAFGTGSHETTWLCIEMLSSMNVANARGLDVGSGSGILALAMLRLGASKVVAFDNDTDAYGALRDNRMRNGIGDVQMPLFIGSIEALRAGVFDVVTMNIIPEVIVPLLPDVVGHVGGELILSGILVVKRDDVVSACAAHGLTLVRERERGEWWAGAFTIQP